MSFEVIQHQQEWPDDPRKANAMLLGRSLVLARRVLDLAEELWLFLEAFGLWCLYTAAPQLWRALQAIWAAVLAIRWGLPQMWRALTEGVVNISSLDAYREKMLAEAKLDAFPVPIAECEPVSIIGGTTIPEGYLWTSPNSVFLTQDGFPASEQFLDRAMAGQLSEETES